MKLIITVYLFLFSYNGIAQKFVNATIIMNNNDTIQAKLKVEKNPFHEELINEVSFYRLLLILDDRQKIKQKIKPSTVKYVGFTDYNGKQRQYVNNGSVLKEVIYDGKKIKWYREISQHIYDGSVQYFDYLVDNNGTKYKFGIFTNNKKKLKEATYSKPELASKIDQIKLDNDADIIEILKEYDQ